jgi:hypothetical protein
MKGAPDKGAFLGLDDVDDLLDAEAQEPKKINVVALVRSAEGENLDDALAEAEAREKARRAKRGSREGFSKYK